MAEVDAQIAAGETAAGDPLRRRRNLTASWQLVARNATQSGFAALAELDGNGDQTIDAADAAFASLRVRRCASGAIREFPCELPTSARSSGTRAPSMLYA